MAETFRLRIYIELPRKKLLKVFVEKWMHIFFFGKVERTHHVWHSFHVFFLLKSVKRFIVLRSDLKQDSVRPCTRMLNCDRVSLYLGCDIGGAKELGVIYFPTNWGAKEPQNLPNHRVDIGNQATTFLFFENETWTFTHRKNKECP